MTTVRSDSAAIAAALARARRRMIHVEFWDGASTALAVALVAGEAAILFGSRLVPPPGMRWAIALGLLVAALAMAATRAVLKRPTLQQTASVIDRRLGLTGRLVTAAQFLGQEDGFAQLVERDAASRLDRLRPRAALPMETPRPALGAALVAVAVPVVFVLSAAWQQGGWTGGFRALGSRTGLAIAAPSAADGKDVRTTNARPSSPSSQVSSTAPRQGVELSPRRTDAPDARERGRPNSSPAWTPDANRDRGSGDGAAGARAQQTASDPSAGAGGIAAGPLATWLADHPGANSDRIENTPGYRAAWLRAQAAVAPARIPVDRRDLIKRYFAAIRPSEHQ